MKKESNGLAAILEPKTGAVYGPVNSRRLGASLGINVLPRGTKTCTFDCLYCQYGWTRVHVEPGPLPNRLSPLSISEVSEFLSSALFCLKAAHQLPRYMTLSGNGEPTLHPELLQLVSAIIRIRDELAPSVQTAILSNSTRVTSPEIRAALAALDLRIMKLDCGSVERFHSFNQPSRGIDLDEITEGLALLSRQVPVTLQTMFAGGKHGNLDRQNIDEWVARVRQVEPEMVQLYTLRRGVPDKHITTAAPDQLETIRVELECAGVRAQVFV